jgi:hypothetical protein
MSVVESLTLTEIRHALENWTREYPDSGEPELAFSDDPPEHFGELSPVLPCEMSLSDGVLVIHARGFPLGSKPEASDLIRGLGPLLSRRRARLLGLEVDELQGYWMATARVVWPRPGVRVGEALELADDVGTLMGAAAGDEPMPSVLVDLIRGGRSHLLVGTFESDSFEAKSAPYRLEDATQQLELAKDVAAMANADGGLILLGAQTKRRGEYDEIYKVNGCRLADVSPRRYRDIIRRVVYPHVEGFAVEPVADPTPGEGVVLLTVPSQDVSQKPFVVSGTVINGRVLGAFVTVPRRIGDETTALDARTLHARLRAGERALADGLTSGLDVIRRELEQTRDSSVPPSLRQVITAARSNGIHIEHGTGTVGFSRPGAPAVVVTTDARDLVADERRTQNLIEKLIGLGLRVRRGPRGNLTPE